MRPHLHVLAALLSAPILLPLAGKEAISSEPVRLTVLLRNYSGIPESSIVEMASSAERVLRKARIEVAIVECAASGAETGPAICSQALDPTTLILRIQLPSLAASGKQVGYAAMTRSGGAYITLLADPARRRSSVESLSDGVLLGHALAHEIGHLLLGPDSHASSGIMRPSWRSADQEWMAKGLVHFTSSESQRMRARLSGLSNR
jgi:hypothetical protein